VSKWSPREWADVNVWLRALWGALYNQTAEGGRVFAEYDAVPSPWGFVAALERGGFIEVSRAGVKRVRLKLGVRRTELLEQARVWDANERLRA
jgi:hypothetical protein